MSRLRIMISSTIQDLSPERDIVDRAIKEFCFERFRSESMGSINRSPQEVCDEMARECDLYILIIGERYGWIIPQTGISVTEREFDIARAADPNKILVYVKKFPQGQREAKVEALLTKVTDFSKGYFRSAPFASIHELKKRVKNDIAVWITDRIREGNLSLSNVFSFPNPKDVSRQAGFSLAIFAMFIILLDIANKIIPSNLFIPAAADLFKVLILDGPTILTSAASTIAISAFAYIFAIVVSTIIICISLISKNRKNGILLFLSLFFSVISLFAFFFGRYLFGFDLIGYLVVSIPPGIAVVLFSAFNETKKEDIGWQTKTSNEKISAFLKNVFLTSGISNAFLATFIITLFQDMMFSGKGLGYLIQMSNLYYQMDKAYVISIVIACVASISYNAIRLFQAYWGWSQIIEPIISHTRQRPKL